MDVITLNMLASAGGTQKSTDPWEKGASLLLNFGPILLPGVA